MRTHNRSRPLVLGAALLAGVAVPVAARAATMVNCDNPGATVQDKIVPGPALLEIVITGTCNENVVITRDDVTLRGDPVTGGAINGPDPSLNTVLVDGGRRIVIDNLRLTGNRNGIVSVRGGSYTVQNSILDGNAGSGAVATLGSSAIIVASQLVNNGGSGLFITDNSAGVITGSTIAGNVSNGISAGRSSSVRVGITLAGVLGPPNTIQNNGANGVSVFQSSQALVQGNTIDQSGGSGVSVFQSSQALVQGNTVDRSGVTGVSAYQSSQALIQGNTIDRSGGSGVVVGSSAATVVGNTITNSGDKGINVFESANARIGITDGNALLGNVIQTSARDGVIIANGAAAQLAGNTIQTSGRHGIQVGRATARLVGQNVIETSAQHGIFIFQGTVFQGQGDFPLPAAGDTVQNNGRSGVVLANSSSAGFERLTITGNNTSGALSQAGIVVDLHSSMGIGNSSITGNAGDGVRVTHDSGVRFNSPAVTISGNSGIELNCTDVESSAAGDMSLIPPPGPENNCSGF